MTVDSLVIVAVITSLASLGVTAFRVFFDRQKTLTEATRNKVDAATLLTNSAMTLIEPLEERIVQ
jgi:hypothetical protein